MFSIYLRRKLPRSAKSAASEKWMQNGNDLSCPVNWRLVINRRFNNSNRTVNELSKACDLRSSAAAAVADDSLAGGGDPPPNKLVQPPLRPRSASGFDSSIMTQYTRVAATKITQFRLLIWTTKPNQAEQNSFREWATARNNGAKSRAGLTTPPPALPIGHQLKKKKNVSNK